MASSSQFWRQNKDKVLFCVIGFVIAFGLGFVKPWKDFIDGIISKFGAKG